MEWYYLVLIILGGLIILYVLGTYILALIMYQLSFTRAKEREGEELYNDLSLLGDWGKFIDTINANKKKLKDCPLEEVEITSYDGLKLFAYYSPAPKPSDTYIVTVHGYRGQCFQDSAIINPFLQEDNYNALFISLRGHYKSEGNYIGFGVPDHKDLIQWINYLDKRINGKGNIFIHGVSMGAGTSLFIVDKELPKSVKGVIADCGFTSAKDEIQYLCTKKYHVPAQPFLFFLRAVVHHKAHYYIDECSTLDTVAHSKLPICFIHGDKDDFVPTKFTYQNYEACTSKKELHIYNGVSHALSQLTYPEDYRKVFNDFINQYKESI